MCPAKQSSIFQDKASTFRDKAQVQIFLAFFSLAFFLFIILFVLQWHKLLSSSLSRGLQISAIGLKRCVSVTVQVAYA
jgi:hypothetical protein